MNVIRSTWIIASVMVKQKDGHDRQSFPTTYALEASSMFPTSAVFCAGHASYTKIFRYRCNRQCTHENVLPGWIDSPPATEDPCQGVLMQRYGKSEEITATVAFLASEGAGYIAGQNFRVDGGLTWSV